MSLISHCPSLHSLSLNPTPKSLFFSSTSSSTSSPQQHAHILCAKRSHRTGKLRYPSEKKKLKHLKSKKLDVKDKFQGLWRFSKLAVDVDNDPGRFSKLAVDVDNDPGKDFLGVSLALLEQIAKVLEFPVASMLPAEAFRVVRKSFDARKLLKTPKFVYTVDMDVNKLLDIEPRCWDFISELEPEVGLVEHMPQDKAAGDLINILQDCKKDQEGAAVDQSRSTIQVSSKRNSPSEKPKVAVVGSGPSGLFAALVLGELGADVTLIERGQPVEQRGRDIGALVARKIIRSESNFCFGEVLGAMGNS